ncbi:DnaJ like chaperone protein [Zhouia amylolytica]|uniref:Heat shock protein DnaJ domain-containing protein n=2 Tax=Zhouia amylolytica TaxID=376730 RepID=W2UJU3_9FLAO|nr:TerB family tellurite resistance protein [Zhouia amylolytica]ETN94239.1 heat shock protein DnaJ domain-containing protein [Zhouia amylolytica AD3]MCQ0111464.1 TerB family tellurite resistance protein [Zhouia amylolytica]SFS39147.1 DnaJ like chaperone protein [Zhouia amylolytica]
MVKWLAAFLGYMIFRLPGAVMGFLLGSFYDMMKDDKGNRSFNQRSSRTVTPADFEMHLISLCAIVIKADGSVNQTELNYVRQYFVSTYGKERANNIFRTFNTVIKDREISAQRVASYLKQRLRYEVRLQLLHFLFAIAKADGAVSKAEIEKIKEIAGYLQVNYRDFESIMAMFVKSADNAYKILEVEQSASNDEVKKAYRTMVKKYHPDKVITEDEAIKKGAEEKFKEVQRAYEDIQKERGF